MILLLVCGGISGVMMTVPMVMSVVVTIAMGMSVIIMAIWFGMMVAVIRMVMVGDAAIPMQNTAVR